MTKSSEIKELILQLLSSGEPYTTFEIKNYLFTEGIGDFSEGQFAGSIYNLLKNNKIEKIDRGIYKIPDEKGSLSKASVDTFLKRCFVVSPIGAPGSDIKKNADQLYQHIISPVCAKCGFYAQRVDELNVLDSITQEILDALTEADLVIADLTGQNSNVFFETGYRANSKKPMILLKRKEEVLPFDALSISAFEYDLTDLDMVTVTKDRLEQIIRNFRYDESESSKKACSNFENNLIVTSLNDIQYKLDVLAEEMKRKENETLRAVLKTVDSQKPEPKAFETEMLKLLLPELLKNPDAAEALLKLSDKLK